MRLVSRSSGPASPLARSRRSKRRRCAGSSRSTAARASTGVAVLRGAPHPNAARLLANFYLGEEAQAIYAKTGHGIVINNLKEKLSPEMESLAGVKPLVEGDFTRIDAHFKNAKEIYK